MQTWIIRYAKCPTNYNEWRNAIVEAETSDVAYQTLRIALGDINGLHNYSLQDVKAYTPPVSPGKVIRL
jgi:hypothetical protein